MLPPTAALDEVCLMKIEAMNYPARNPLQELEWIGNNAFDFVVDFILGPPAADPEHIDRCTVRADPVSILAIMCRALRSSAARGLVCRIGRQQHNQVVQRAGRRQLVHDS